MRHITRHFRDKPLEEIDCTGNDDQKQLNKTLHTPWKTRDEQKKKPALANKTN